MDLESNMSKSGGSVTKKKGKRKSLSKKKRDTNRLKQQSPRMVTQTTEATPTQPFETEPVATEIDDNLPTARNETEDNPLVSKKMPKP